MKTKLLNMLGLCRRAGRLSMGNDPVIDSVKKKESCLILLAEDLSEKTEKKLRNAVSGVELIKIPITMSEIGFSIGKVTGIISINDKGFAAKIEEYADMINEIK